MIMASNTLLMLGFGWRFFVLVVTSAADVT
jgi:hypothetical protein